MRQAYIGFGGGFSVWKFPGWGLMRFQDKPQGLFGHQAQVLIGVRAQGLMGFGGLVVDGVG